MNHRTSALLLIACLVAGVGSVYGSPGSNAWQADVDVVVYSTTYASEVPAEVNSPGSAASSRDLVRDSSAAPASLASVQGLTRTSTRLYVLYQVYRI